MEKLLFLFILLCSTFLKVQSLQCYVCDNCPKVELSVIQTCGALTTPGSLTTAKTTTKFTSISTTITTEPSTFVAVSTTSTTIPKLPTISTSSKTEPSPTSITTDTIEEPTTEFKPLTTKPTTKYPTTSTESTKKSDTTPTISITYSATTATKPPVLLTTESNILATDLTTTLITAYLNTTPDPNIISTTESINSSTSTPNASEPSNLSTSQSISEPSTIATQLSITYTTESTISPTINSTESSSTNPSSTFISATQPITPEPMTATNYTTEEPSNLTDPAIVNTETNGDRNAAIDLLARRSRSMPKDCACENVDKCDCSTINRSKRYALRGLATNEYVKYTCVVDKYDVNGREIVRRGCAILEEDEKTSCEKSGFGAECKTCDTDQCNGASMIQCSAVLLFILYCSILL